MLFPSPWDYTTTVVRHHYYDQKPSFEREVDVYEMWAAFAVVKGEFTYHIGTESGELSEGQIVVCPPGAPFRRLTRRPISFHYFLFHWVDGQGKPMPAHSSHTSACMSFADVERFHSSLSTLCTPTFAQHPTYRLWQTHVLLDLFRLYSMEEAMPPGHHRPAVTDPQMEAAIKQLQFACDEPITISSVAAEFAMNSVQFSRRFQRAYGIKPSAYVEKLKLDKVCHLLTHTAMTIEQIALACGFNNGFYLSRYFSLKMNLAPSEYRNQYRV